MTLTRVTGPCASARMDVDTRCADAERLAAHAQARHETLREARRTHAQAAHQRESDARLRDRRRVADAKADAKAEYHSALTHASDERAVHNAATVWLERINQLNRGARLADRRADATARRVNELERAIPGLELAADAARISAEAAHVACLEARRVLAACEEDSASALDTVGAVHVRPVVADRADMAGAAAVLMRGDRQTLLAIALGLADETGFEAGRLQLLLLELREQITTRALDNNAVVFPSDDSFWGQFSERDARGLAASLASLGFRFDGVDGWVDGRAPQARDLANALSYCGFDPRSLRRPSGPADMDTLWHGTRLTAQEFLLANAPELTLPELTSLLGPASRHLAELWDVWGRLRPLLVGAGSQPMSM